MSEPVTPRARGDFFAALVRQDAKGQQQYGGPLTTFNGRDHGAMCLEELVDAVQYLTALRMEVDVLRRHNQYLLDVCRSHGIDPDRGPVGVGI